MPTPVRGVDGSCTPRPDARLMRVYNRVDTRLMFEDFFLEPQELAAGQATS